MHSRLNGDAKTARLLAHSNTAIRSMTYIIPRVLKRIRGRRGRSPFNKSLTTTAKLKLVEFFRMHI